MRLRMRTVATTAKRPTPQREEEQRLVHVRGRDPAGDLPAHPDAPAHDREAGEEERARGEVERAAVRGHRRDRQQQRERRAPTTRCAWAARGCRGAPPRGARRAGAPPTRRSPAPRAGRPRSARAPAPVHASPGCAAGHRPQRALVEELLHPEQPPLHLLRRLLERGEGPLLLLRGLGRAHQLQELRVAGQGLERGPARARGEPDRGGQALVLHGHDRLDRPGPRVEGPAEGHRRGVDAPHAAACRSRSRPPRGRACRAA